MSVVVKASHVYKVFGKRPNEVIKRLEEGADRKDLTKLGTAAVIDASFEVEEGEIFVVMGLSGSGKSTLIRTLNGLWDTSGGVRRSARHGHFDGRLVDPAEGPRQTRVDGVPALRSAAAPHGA